MEIVYYVAATIDGYIADEKGGIDWLKPFEASGEDYGWTGFYDSVDAVLVGRTTYEQSLGHGFWPYPGKPVWVFTSRDLAPAEGEVHATAEAPRAVLGELESRGLQRAWLVGGGRLAGALRSEGLITEYIISVIPLFLGGGIPLAGGAGPRDPLRLVDSRSYGSGIVQLRYRTDGSR